MASAQLYISSSPRVISEDMTSQSSQSSSSHDSSDDEVTSPDSEVAVLTLEEIEALRRYSHSIQNFTYQLFENFRMEAEARAAAPAGDKSVPTKTSTATVSGNNAPVAVAVFHSTVVMPPPDACVGNVAGTSVPGRRKPSDCPRRKARGIRFPEHTGL